MDLKGQKILITRERAESLIAKLEAKGAEVFHVPCIALVEPEDWSLFDQAAQIQEQYSTLLFTSQEAVSRTCKRCREIGLPLSQHFKIAVVGPKTEEALKHEGYQATYIPKDYQAEGLIALFKEQKILGDKIWFPRALVAREGLIQSLKQLGNQVQMTPCYKNIIPQQNKMQLQTLVDQGLDWILFASSSSVNNFLELYGGSFSGKTFPKIASIGKVTTIELEKNHIFATVTAKIQTLDGLVSALEAYGR